MEKVNLFISYAHKDKDHLPELFTYLNETTCPQIDIWHDERISLGQEWNDEIKNNLDKAEIVLLLISQDFLMSHYIRNNELSVVLQRHDEGKSTVIPIFLRYCKLENYPQITKLQGYPGTKTPLLEMDIKKDRSYTEIQDKINEIAEKIIINKNISKSLDKDSGAQDPADERYSTAKEIDHLRKIKKIFLSIPASEEGLEVRKNFISTVEGKIKYDTPKWPYEVVPGIQESGSIINSDSKDQQQKIAGLLDQSIYVIHILGTGSDLKDPLFVMQYKLAKESVTASNLVRQILWLSNASIREELDFMEEAFNIELKKLPAVIGTDYKAVFNLIEEFDNTKQRDISRLSVSFSPLKKIFMFYDFEKDNENELRIKLRKEIQKDKKFAIRDLADESFENQKKGIEECNGALIFYGAESDSIWYKMRERIILKAGNIRKGAVCVDGPEIEKKIDRDVSVTEILTIKGEKDLEPGITTFKKMLDEEV